MATIGKSGRKTLCIAYTNSMPFGDVTDNLYVGILVLNLVDIIKMAAVDIFVRKLIQHIERGLYS